MSITLNLDFREDDGFQLHNELYHKMTFTFCQNRVLFIISYPDREDQNV